MPITVPYGGYTPYTGGYSAAPTSTPVPKKKFPWNPVNRNPRAGYQTPVAPVLTHGQLELIRNAQGYNYLGAQGGYNPQTAALPVFNIPGAPGYSPRSYAYQGAYAGPPTRTGTTIPSVPAQYRAPRRAAPTGPVLGAAAGALAGMNEPWSYVNFPRLQGPPAPRQPSGMLGYTPPLYSPSAGGAGGYGGYGGYGYGGGYGGGYSETPSAGYVQPGPRLTAGGSPYVAPRATPNAFEYAGPGRMVSGIQPQALLPRWYRNLTSWRFG